MPANRRLTSADLRAAGMTELPMTTLQSFADALLDPEAPLPAGLHTWNASAPAQRFRVYRNNVAVSLVDALADNYPVVQALVGEAFFRAMARRFVAAHPPAGPVLALYGSDFAAYIAAFPPAGDVPYLADVARLEWGYQCAWHGPDAPSLRAEQLASALADPERLHEVRLHLHPTALPFHAPHAAVSLWSAHQSADPVEVSAQLAAIDPYHAESAFIVRDGLDVAVILLPAPAVAFLSELGHGICLGEAAQAAQAADPEFELVQTLGLALRTGLFTRVGLPDATGENNAPLAPH